MSGKRANTFGQGRPENPYDDQDENETPQRATAAQLAQRKIKTAKTRRQAGSASTTSASANFGAPTGGFNFGASAPAPSNNANGLSFGASNAFGGGANNSFPPAQSSAPSNTFTNSSFPAFGGSNQSTSFNPQPPSTGFNFIAGNSNPFAASNGATPISSAPSTSAFGGGGIFSSQAPSNPFQGLPSGLRDMSTPVFTSSGGMFGTTSSAPPTNMFGTTSSAPNFAGSAPAPAPAPFTFGTSSSSAQNTASTPAATSIFGTLGGSDMSKPATASSNMFGFGTSTTKAENVPAAAPTFSAANTSAQGMPSTTSTASTPSLFNFGSNAQKTESTPAAAPAVNIFGASGAATPTSTAASNPFASLPTATASTPAPTFSFSQSASQDKPASNPFGGLKLPDSVTDTSKPALFSSIKTPQQSTPAPAEKSQSNPFASLAKPAPAPASTSAFNFGTTQNKEKTGSAGDKLFGATPSKATEAPKFGGFSTPQPAKTTEVEKPQAGLFSAQPKSSSGIFSQSFAPQNQNAGNTFKPQSAFAPAKSQPTQPTDSGSKQASSAEPSNPFAKLPTPSAPRSNLFAPSKEAAPAPKPVPTPALAPASSPMPNLTSGASSITPSSDAPELPKIPKAHVPKEWANPAANASQTMDASFDMIVTLTEQIHDLNRKYRNKLSTLPSQSDWSALSLWHHKHASALKQKLDAAKKQRAASKGITGKESSLSTKRKVNDDSPEGRNASPSKRARPADPMASPTPQPSAMTPKLSPPSSTSNMFAKAISSQPTPAESKSQPEKSTNAPTTANAFGFKPSVPTTNGSSAPDTASAFGFKPSVPATNGSSTSSSLFSGGFKPSTTTSSGSSGGGFKPTTSASSGGFASQFASTAKTYEQLAAERKKKAKDADYDSDDETEEEWSARYDKEEAERLAKEKAEAASISGFSMPASAKTSGASTPAASLFASPAVSTSGNSIFGTTPARVPSPNIFGHLSSGPTSNNEDDSDEDGEQPVGSVEPTTPPKRKHGESDTEADEDNAVSRKKPATSSKPSLLSRMTRDADDGSESEKENKSSGSIFGQSNGTSTPTNKPFTFFDFGAAGAQTAPPKSDTFGGDQTFKPGTPIKFGQAPATEKKADKAPPTFSFQPASTSTTPSKPPPTSLFNFGQSSGNSSLLTPAGGFSGLNSIPSSTFTSRAATPLSEAETSAQSGAEDDEEGNQEQVDLSKLTGEELASNDIVFETDAALAKHQVDKGDGEKTWENFARGPLWILKDKVSGKCFVRIRIASGATPLNYNILPALKTQVIGSSGKMIQATMPKKEGGIAQIFISVKTPEIAKEFSTKYNESLPS